MGTDKMWISFNTRRSIILSVKKDALKFQFYEVQF